MTAEPSSPRTTDYAPEEAFNVLGNELRLQILFGLWDAYDPFDDDDAVAFSDLYEKVDVDDSGQFNYHLDKLRDRYITQQGEGYALSPVGLRLVQSVIAGAGQEVDFGPVEVDTDCRNCGAATVLTYSRGRLFHCCTNCDGNFEDAAIPDGALWGQTIARSGLESRTPEELMTTLDFVDYPRTAKISGGICPQCSGVLDHMLDVCDDHSEPDDGPCPECLYTHRFRWRRVCQVCKFDGRGSIPGLLKVHPAAITFQYRNDLDFGYPYRPLGFEEMKDLEEERRSVEFTEELRSRDPLRIAVTIEYRSNWVEFVLDEALEVLEVIES